jgi:hypothetical protein
MSPNFPKIYHLVILLKHSWFHLDGLLTTVPLFSIVYGLICLLFGENGIFGSVEAMLSADAIPAPNLSVWSFSQSRYYCCRSISTSNQDWLAVHLERIWGVSRPWASLIYVFLLFLNHNWIYQENSLVDGLNIRGLELEWLVSTLSMRSLLIVSVVYVSRPAVSTNEKCHSTTSNWKDSVIVEHVQLSYL